MTIHYRHREWNALVLLSLIWGTSFLFTKTAVSAIPPTTVVSARLLIAAVVLTAMVRSAGLRFPRSASVWVYFAAMAVVGNALPFFLITWGQETIDSGLAGVLMAVMPLATLVLAHCLVDDEAMTTPRALGFVIGFGGTVVLVGPEALRELGGAPSEFLPQIAVLAGALCYAVNTIIARRAPQTDVLVVAAAVMTIAAAVMLPLALIVDTPWSLDPSAVSACSVVWLGLVSTALAMVIYFRLIMVAGPTFLSLINYMIPVVAVIAGVAVLGEKLEWRLLAALSLVLAGIAVSGATRPSEVAHREIPR